MKKGIVIKKTKSPQLNKVLTDIEETLNGIDDKLRELRELDKGSKFIALFGWMLMGFGGGGLLTIAVLFKDQATLLSYIIVFLLSSLMVTLIISGFALAHKGLTGEWL